MKIRFLNTLGREVQEFEPLSKNEVKMYVCGPTVYNYIHIGNARCYVVFDVLKRFLKSQGYKVIHVQNFTDVDDKIIKRAQEEGVSPAEVSRKYEAAFIEDMEALGVEKPDYTPRATEFIDRMIEIIKTLIDKGFAYEIEGSVYFRVDSFPDYGKLSGRSKEELLAGARVEVDERKENPLDFALWKSAKPGEPFWESPWGKGRPGWHIECSAMSSTFFGPTFDIHGGGEDLIFPHHENEIAQSEAFSGIKPFVRYWLHNGLLTIRSEKMAKSVGNIILLRELLKKYHPNALRIFYLSTSYRSQLDYSEERMVEAVKAWERLEQAWDSLQFFLQLKGKEVFSEVNKELGLTEEAFLNSRKAFYESLANDLNTARALAALFELVKQVNKYLQGRRLPLIEKERELFSKVSEFFSQAAYIFGLQLGTYKDVYLEHRKADIFKLKQELGLRSKGLKEIISEALERREKARLTKNWVEADSIREKLKEAGIEVEDTLFGPRWRFQVVEEAETDGSNNR